MATSTKTETQPQVPAFRKRRINALMLMLLHPNPAARRTRPKNLTRNQPPTHARSCVPACRKKSFYDPEARALRSRLRTAYEALLFLDAQFAAANDVEVLLWKSVFYRPIEEFRSRLKQADKVCKRLCMCVCVCVEGGGEQHAIDVCLCVYVYQASVCCKQE